jgi:hypothetical protein
MDAESRDHVVAENINRVVRYGRTTKNQGATRVSGPSDRPSTNRWVWSAFFLLVLLPLYGIATVVCIRSDLFRLNGASLSNDQFKAIWAFLAAGLATAATVLASILTRSHNIRALAFQAESSKRQELLDVETNERLKLDTVVRCLSLICHDGVYSPKAVTAAGLATLVQLGHPIVAMRALAAAFQDEAVDANTAAWLIGEVLQTSKTKGGPADLVSAKEEAANLLRAYAPDLTDRARKGNCFWPDTVTARWPSGLSRNASQNVIIALGELLLSKSKEWWSADAAEGSTYTWIVYTLDEAVKSGVNDSVKRHAAAVGVTILEVTADERMIGIENSRPKSEVAERMATVLDGRSPEDLLPEFFARTRTWAEAQPDPASPSAAGDNPAG